MDTTAQLAHSHRLKVALTFLCCFATLGVAALYHTAGAAPAIAFAGNFAILGAFARWSFKRAAAWRSANPSSQNQFVPISAMGGFKMLALVILASTFTGVSIVVLFHLLRT